MIHLLLLKPMSAQEVALDLRMLEEVEVLVVVFAAAAEEEDLLVD
jgi:hypothetical protein